MMLLSVDVKPFSPCDSISIPELSPLTIAEMPSIMFVRAGMNCPDKLRDTPLIAVFIFCKLS